MVLPCVVMSDRPEIDELQARLRQAQQDVDAANARVRRVPAEPGAMQRMSDAMRARTDAQRRLAALQNLEWADELAWPHDWDPGAPCPQLVSSIQRTYLVYLVHDPELGSGDPYALGTIHTDDATFYDIATVTFEGCYGQRFGRPSEQHPLIERGFDGYRAFLVHNSRWLDEARTIHPRNSPASWAKLNHYLFGFRSHLFECLAESYGIDVRCETFATALERCARMLVTLTDTGKRPEQA
jgi:hypothetical protein